MNGWGRMNRWLGGGNSLLFLLLLQLLGGEARATPNADLIQAIQEKHVEGVRQALENGADVNVRDEGQGTRSFEYYLNVGHCLDTLLDLGGMTSLIPEEGLPPLFMAMQFLDSEALALVELLLHYGADVNASVPDEHFKGLKKGWTALITAVENDHVEMAELLLHYGADVNVVIPAGSDEGWTALITAVEHDTLDMVELLLHYGADVNVVIPTGSHEGWTALITAVEHDHIEMVERLLHHGADVTFTVSEGAHASDSALLIAEAHKNLEMIELLTQAGATPLDPDQQTKTLRMRKERFANRRFNSVQCGRRGRCFEEHDMPYELYILLGESMFCSISLPKEAEHIDWFFYTDAGIFGDTTYEFVQAPVKLANRDLNNLVAECRRADLEDAMLIKNVSFTMEGFYTIAGLRAETDRITPLWLDNGDAMQDFPLNVVTFGETPQGYGEGCWAFYHEKTHMVRVFRWTQQHLSVKRFCNAFQIETCKEDDALVPMPSSLKRSQDAHCETLLQQFALHDLQVIGIIMGGLGEYARIQTPDGKRYTIGVGSCVGENAGEVVEILEKSVRVRERIQDEHGRIQDGETVLSLQSLNE